jgi:hypothetical protein
LELVLFRRKTGEVFWKLDLYELDGSLAFRDFYEDFRQEAPGEISYSVLKKGGMEILHGQLF